MNFVTFQKSRWQTINWPERYLHFFSYNDRDYRIRVKFCAFTRATAWPWRLPPRLAVKTHFDYSNGNGSLFDCCSDNRCVRGFFLPNVAWCCRNRRGNIRGRNERGGGNRPNFVGRRVGLSVDRKPVDGIVDEFPVRVCHYRYYRYLSVLLHGKTAATYFPPRSGGRGGTIARV